MITFDEKENVEGLQAKKDYIFRVDGVFANQGRDPYFVEDAKGNVQEAHSLFVSINTIVVGDVLADGSIGTGGADEEVPFPVIMLSHPERREKVVGWVANYKRILGKLVSVTDMPTAAGELTETMKRLKNVYFQGQVSWDRGNEKYEGKWVIDTRAIRGVVNPIALGIPDLSMVFMPGSSEEVPF